MSDFFSRDFPSGQVKVEARTSSKSLLSGASFSDEFKVTAIRDLGTGAITTEVKNTSAFPLIKSSKMGTDRTAWVVGHGANLLFLSRVEAKTITTLTSNNLLTQQLTISNAVLDGLKLDFTGSLQPNGYKRHGMSVSPSLVALVPMAPRPALSWHRDVSWPPRPWTS